AKKCRDGQKINVPFQKEIKKNIKKETTISNPIDLNKANLKELMTIPGIGKILAQRIIEYRAACGGFSSFEELSNIKGFSNKKLKEIKNYIK
ncbi:MAG: helix-hairpin-helix domain-containing protein, partial [Candidatus Margulisiibacteriota bacterium]